MAALVVVLIGCRDRPAAEAPRPGSATPAAGSGSAGAASSHVLPLPKLAGTPAAKSPPLDAARARALSERAFAGWDRDVRLADAKGLEVRYRTRERPTLMVTVQAAPCFDCLPIDEAAWRARSDALRGLIGPELRDAPETTWELGATELAGTRYVWTYHVGYSVAPGGTGLAGAYGTAYALHYNDGVNMIRVVAEYKDDAPTSREAMVALAPRQDLEQIAKAFVDAFVHAW